MSDANLVRGPSGGVPKAGRERLAQNREGLFTSDLSVNEFMLIRDAGFEPVGLVVGSSIYHIGVQVPNWMRNQEMTVLSEAMYNARDLAMSRMEAEADDLSADGVVGVRLRVSRYDVAGKMAEFIAVGTAVRHREGVSHRAANGKPFTSDLSGQAFWTLLRTGYRPVGLVMGSCVYHVAHRGPAKVIGQVARNIELPNYTQALYSAREIAMERMQSEAQTLKAGGIVGVDLQENRHGWGAPPDRVLRGRNRGGRNRHRGGRLTDTGARLQRPLSNAFGVAPAQRAATSDSVASSQHEDDTRHR